MMKKMDHGCQLFELLFVLSTANILSGNSGARANYGNSENVILDSIYSGGFFGRVVIGNPYFVDKSLLIKDFLESPDKVTLVTCPEGWGKKTNMDMIKIFLQPELDLRGKLVPKKDAFNYRVFELGEANTGKLNIAKHRGIMDRYLGQWPVIYLDLLWPSSHVDADSALLSLCQLLIGAFDKHDYMLELFLRQSNDTSASETERSAAREHYDLFRSCLRDHFKSITTKEMKTCFKFFCERLYQHFGRKPFILIDDYDMFFFSNWPQMSWKDHSRDKQFMDQIVGVLQWFMTTILSDNSLFEKALLTGVVNFEIPRIFSALPGLKVNNVIRNDLYKHYGLMEDEVSRLFKEHNITGKLAEDGRKWHGGYTIENDLEASFYDIGTTVRFLKEREIRNWFRRPGLYRSNDVEAFVCILSSRMVRSMIRTLADGKSTVAFELNHLIVTNDEFVALSKKICAAATSGTQDEVNVFLRLCLANGFLTVDHKVPAEFRMPGHVCVRAPNLQVIDLMEGGLARMFW